MHTVDTLGAGDVFHDKFTLAVAEKQDLVEALRFASAEPAALECHQGSEALLPLRNVLKLKRF